MAMLATECGRFFSRRKLEAVLWLGRGEALDIGRPCGIIAQGWTADFVMEEIYWQGPVLL